VTETAVGDVMKRLQERVAKLERELEWHLQECHTGQLGQASRENVG